MRCYFENIKHILCPIQAGLVSRDFCLHDFALTLLEIYTTFRIYAIILDLTLFGIDDTH